MAEDALFTDTRVRNVTQYVSALAGIRRRRRILWFRGQNNIRWQLLPSLARLGKEWLSAEAMLMKRFRQNAIPLLPPQASRTDWDWLLLMQHYGVPTRLLDWTENALAGLFFATISVRGRDTGGTDGCVWVLDPVALNGEANMPGASNDIPTLDVDGALRDYLPTSVAAAVTTRPPLAVLAQRMFPRLVAQQGVFTLVHRERMPIERIRRGAYVGRIIVPRTAKVRIARELGDMGVTRLSLFPELDSVAEFVKGFLR